MNAKKYSFDIIYQGRNMLFGIATILVLMVHATQYSWPSGTEIAKKIFAEGSIGVDVFLLLSGVGLYKSYQSSTDVKEFFGRRMCRILPVFIPIGGIFYAIMVLQREEGFLDYLLHISTLSFWVKGESCTWYISYILFFYLLFPLIYKVINVVPSWIGIPSAFGIELLLRFGGMSNEDLAIAISRVLITITGVYVGKWAVEKRQINLWLVFMAIIPFIVIRLYRLIYIDESQAELVTYYVKTANAFVVFTFVVIFSILSKYVPVAIRKVLETMGSISLETYLVHNFIGAVYHGFNVNQSVIIYVVLVVPISIFMAFWYRRCVALMGI